MLVLEEKDSSVHFMFHVLFHFVLEYIVFDASAHRAAEQVPGHA